MEEQTKTTLKNQLDELKNYLSIDAETNIISDDRYKFELITILKSVIDNI